MAFPPATRKRLILTILVKLIMLVDEATSSSTANIQLATSLLTSQALLTAFAYTFAHSLLPRASPVTWAHARPVSFTESYLLGSYTAAMFKNRLRVSRDVFQYLCESLGPSLRKESTNMREPIPVETRIAASLYRLGHTCAAAVISDLFGIGTSTVSPVLREFVRAVLQKLKPIYIRNPVTAEHLQELSEGFKKVRGIPTVFGAIDGSHIPISKPKQWAPDYYNRKGFYSILLQGVVDAECKFWDYDIGWAGSLHDYNLFKRTALFRRLVNGDFGNYALLGDAAYQPRSYVLTPFLGSKEGLSRQQFFWNFIQSSSRMPVECAFGILKMRWACLLLRLDLDIHFVSDVVAACLVLHNICRIHNDGFDSEWVKEVKSEIEKETQANLHRFSTAEAEAIRAETFQQLEKGIKAVEAFNHASERSDERAADALGPRAPPQVEGLEVEDDPAPEDQPLQRELDEGEATGQAPMEIEEGREAFEVGKRKRLNLARVLYDANCRKKVRLMYGLEKGSSSDSEEDMHVDEDHTEMGEVE
jgi:hypothetical protein